MSAATPNTDTRDVLVSRILDVNDAFNRGEISHEEANRVISIFANALREMSA